MKKILLLIITSLILTGSFYSYKNLQIHTQTTGAPPYGEPESSIPELDPRDWIHDWVRPEGPTKVALQVGHWKNEEVPEELNRLKGNTGASGGGKSEWEVNYAIAQETKNILEAQSILVEILPATVPPKYYADAFISIHADGNPDTTKTGYKAATSWRDFSGKSSKLVEFIEQEYATSTGLRKDDNITRNMRGYYAFSWWRYDHAVHPMTPSAILETGFLTSPGDREIIVDKYKLSAQGLAEGVLKYLKTEKLL